MASTTLQMPSGDRQLWQFLESLTQGEITPVNSDYADPPRFLPGVLYEVNEQVYWLFLELLPPRWMHGNWFAFGEGTGPFRLFWKLPNRHFARELTTDETVLFCQLSRTSRHV